MKSLRILFLGLMLIPLSLSAQSDSSTYFPSKGFFGFGLNATGLINNARLTPYQDSYSNDLIFARYFFSDKSALRLGFGLELNQFQQSVTDSLGAAQRNFDTSYAQPSTYIEFGIERHLFTTKRLDPYFGAALNLGLEAQSRIKTSLSIEDTTGTATLTTDARSAGGFRIGVSGIVGFNYFVAKNFAIGAEYVLSYSYSQTGGDFDRVIVTTPVTGQSSSRREIGSDLIRQNTIDLNGTLAIRLSYYFPTRNRDS